VGFRVCGLKKRLKIAASIILHKLRVKRLIDFKAVDKKWQARWEKARLFDANFEKGKKKFFTSIVIPYVNGSVHIGHSFTYGRTDAYARFKRMQGLNVLQAVGFHATGEPILGAVERLRKGDATQIETFKLYGASDADIERFKKEGPEYVAKFWAEKIEADFKAVGYGVDWRRKFVTALTPTFNRFIEWQYNTLRKRGYVVQGTHPVVWCPKDQSPTGDHDRLEGEGESPIDYVLLKFSFDLDGEKMILPAATLRPETIYGVVNMWVNPDADYVRAKVDGETWLISRDAAKKLADQLKRVEILSEVRGGDLLGKKCKDPLSGKDIPILPAHFVDPENATGIVMSVPAHAPYDWAALRELLDKPEQLERFGVKAQELEPISLIKTEGFGESPAAEICKKLKVTSTKQRAELDTATSEVYKREFHMGVLKENTGKYAGMKVSAAKDKLIADFKKAGIADTMWETTGLVVCRCTTKNHVKILENQWFLKYSDKKWKLLARAALRNAKIFPEEARRQFEETINWLKDKACARKSGLGTPLPWDKSWIVETLSDSTVYMSYYTIARLLNEKKIPAGRLTDEVLDYVFLGRGKINKVAKSAKLSPSLLKEMRREFEYFYPVDFRNSAKELVPNHLTFFIFQHAAIWPRQKYWPKAIGVNGFGIVEGEKMSKSKGNIIPLADAVKQFGADIARANMITAAEGVDDADWRAENVRGLRARLQMLFDVATDLNKAKGKGTALDKWLRSRMQRYIEAAGDAYEQTKFRSGFKAALYDSTRDIKWYLGRVGGIEKASKKVLSDTLSEVARMIAPLTPHIAEELWEKLGNEPFVANAKWPKSNTKLIDRKAEEAEDMVARTAEDVRSILKIVKKKAGEIRIYPLRPAEFAALKGARDWMAKELGAPVNVVLAKKSTSEKAKRAKLGKPGIEII